MRIIGWIRQNDRAACGGTVAEGFARCTNDGVPYAYQGARMACKKNWIIGEGFARRSLDGRQFVIHGMKTSGDCPLVSTLNDIDGDGNDAGVAIPLDFTQDRHGQWINGVLAGQIGTSFLIKNSETGAPIGARRFIAFVEGARQEGTTDRDGYAHIDAPDGAAIAIHALFEAPNGSLTEGDV